MRKLTLLPANLCNLGMLFMSSICSGVKWVLRAKGRALNCIVPPSVKEPVDLVLRTGIYED